MMSVGIPKRAPAENNYRWLHYQKVPNFLLPPTWRSWVVDQGSLTKRLIHASDGDFRVQLTSNKITTPSADEQLLLKMAQREQALIREVSLICHNEVWVTARSIVPLTTLNGAERQLAYLGEKPLGGFLFSARTMKRTPFQFGQRHYINDQGIVDNQWARRSVFFLHKKPLLVTEYFEPAIINSNATLSVHKE